LPSTDPTAEPVRPGTLVHLPRPTPLPQPLDDPRLSDVDEWGRSEHMREIARRLYDPMYRYWFRAEWEGLEKIPTTGGALLVANHAGAIPSDAPAIMHGIETELHRPVYGLADNLFRAIPMVGTMWSRVGGVAAHPENAYRLLREQQELVLVFPEGTKGPGKLYSERYKLRRFGRGGSMPIVTKLNGLAKLLRAPYVPITANMLMFGPLGTLMYFPAKFRLKVLDPVSFDVPADQDRYSKSRVMDEAEAIRVQLQETLYDMLRARRSVWFG
jgi:1-acyl-sn-glycerol-3-phosphate acyltransferase